MIRVVAGASLVVLALLVLYLPSAHPPERFVAHMRAEHVLNGSLWGNSRAVGILDRALSVYGAWAATPALPPAFRESAATPDAVLAWHMNAATGRLLESGYFRSIDALLALALYRIASLAEWLQLMAVLLVAAVFDGVVCRRVRSKEFRQHNPELFALHVSLAVLALCATGIALVLPVALHPLLLAAAPLLLAVLINRAIANFHARG